MEVSAIAMDDRLSQILQNGENSLVEFKLAEVSPQSLAEEIAAFANTAGGSIFIGVADDGAVPGIDAGRKAQLEEKVMNICRHNINPPIIPIYETIRLGDKWIARVTIAEGIEKPYQTVQGKYLVRVGSTRRTTSREELLRLFQNARVFHIDDAPVAGTTLESLDLSKLSAYFRDIYDLTIKDMNEPDQEQLFVNAGILGKVQEKVCATVTGLVFFALDEYPISIFERYLPQAGMQFVAYEDDRMESILDTIDIYRSFPEAIDDLVQKIKINWKTPSQVVGLKREEVAFPKEIFRELVVNAVVHRDYSIPRKIQVRMFPGRVEIITPGRLVNTVTVDRMKAGISVLRNPILVKFMQNYRYADQLGRGIPMILRRIEKMKTHELDLIPEDHQFTAIFLKCK